MYRRLSAAITSRKNTSRLAKDGVGGRHGGQVGRGALGILSRFCQTLEGLGSLISAYPALETQKGNRQLIFPVVALIDLTSGVGCWLPAPLSQQSNAKGPLVNRSVRRLRFPEHVHWACVARETS
jgi:hypothetical protein